MFTFPSSRAWLVGVALASGAWAAAAFDLQGHRGARGLAPENTLAGFRQALVVGVSTLELDVHVTADGHLVVHHDPAFNTDIARDESGQWLTGPQPPLKTLTLAQVQAVDVGRVRPGSKTARNFASQQPADGEIIPTLDAVLALLNAEAAKNVRVNIEIKLDPRKPELHAEASALVAAVHQALKTHGLSGRAMVQSFNWEPLKLSQQLAPDVPTAYLTIQQPDANTLHGTHWTAGMQLDDHGSAPRMVKAAGGRYWTPFHKDLSAALVSEAKALGLQVIPWTVNHPRDMQRMIDLGVDGLITDYPDRAREMMRENALPLPQPLAP